MSTTGHHTLADQLRSRDDEELIALLTARPDLATPMPGDFGALAGRAHAPTSIARALEQLTLFELQILEAIRLAPRHRIEHEAFQAQLAPYYACGLPADKVQEALDTLSSLALVWNTGTHLRIVGAVDEILGPYPSGLGRELRELTRYHSIGEILGFVQEMPAEAEALVKRLTAGPPIGTFDARQPSTAMTWLLDRGIVVSIGTTGPDDTESLVELPREVGIFMRGESPFGKLEPTPPPTPPLTATIDTIDAAGSAAASELLRHMEALLAECARQPLSALRAGGIGVKEQRRLATALDLKMEHVALLLEIAASAGLLGAEKDWLPTVAFDTWRVAQAGQQWAELALSWIQLGTLPSLANHTDHRGRRVNPLSHEMTRTKAPRLRILLLEQLRHPSQADTAIASMRWYHPRIVAAAGVSTMRDIWSEAELLGVVARGAIPSFAKPLLSASGSPNLAEASARLSELLPPPVDYFLVQPDLTVVAPGPLTPELAAHLAAVAELESTGGATVYRVTTGSVRRALGVGYSTEALHTLFDEHSRTPIPQNLTYLINDVSRNYGTIRLGAAGTYVRSEEATRLAELLADRNLAALQLRPLAPTVAISPLPAHLIADFLAEAGHNIAAEDSDGALTNRQQPRKRAHRAPRLGGEIRLGPVAAPPPTLQAIARLRHSDELARKTSREHEPVEHDMETILTVLRDAVSAKTSVVVGYLSPHGALTLRTVKPVSVGGGYLRAEDPRTESALTFALHRIASVTPHTP